MSNKDTNSYYPSASGFRQFEKNNKETIYKLVGSCFFGIFFGVMYAWGAPRWMFLQTIVGYLSIVSPDLLSTFVVATFGVSSYLVLYYTYLFCRSLLIVSRVLKPTESELANSAFDNYNGYNGSFSGKYSNQGKATKYLPLSSKSSYYSNYGDSMSFQQGGSQASSSQQGTPELARIDNLL